MEINSFVDLAAHMHTLLSRVQFNGTQETQIKAWPDGDGEKTEQFLTGSQWEVTTLVETPPRYCTNVGALPTGSGDTQSIRHNRIHLVVNSDPKLFYRYLAFNLTLLSNSEEYCRQQGTELPVVINKAASSGTQ